MEILAKNNDSFFFIDLNTLKDLLIKKDMILDSVTKGNLNENITPQETERYPLCDICHVNKGTELINEDGKDVLICLDCDLKMEWEK